MVDEQQRDPVSSRGLTSGGLGTPLRDIRGTLAGYRTEERQIEGTNRKSVSVMLQLANLEVFKSEEPYAFPTAEIRIPLSNSTNSRWGILADSANKIQLPTEDFPKSHEGKAIRLTVTPGHKLSSRNRETNKWEDVVIEAWEVVEIAGKTKGAAGANPMDELINLLDGKTKAEFNSIALAHPFVRSSADAQRGILDSSIVEGLVTTGVFTVDTNKMYHKVKK